MNKLYPSEWVEQYRQSILNQTYKEFTIFEVNYGGGKERIFEHSDFDSFELPTFTHVLNYLFFKAITAGFDCVANSNVDDWFTEDRLERQLPYIKDGYDIVTSNFSLVENDQIIKTHSFDKLNLELELSHNHNIVCHPTVIYSRNFIDNNKYVPEQMPLEDLMLWQRTIKNYKFVILPDVLCYHRLHENSVCKSQNR